MTDWADGYVSGVTYSTGFYRETTPAWLSMATVLAGHRPPRLDRRFRWCELGCGQGFTALAVAACHPQAEVFGFDFNPAHIDNARVLAAQAGIGNANFAEASFEELANAPRGALPAMDFIVMHGVWSWVSSTQRAHLLRFIGERLAPGGIVYVSYNGLAGWAAMLPVQRLIRLLSEIRPGPAEEVMQGALGFVNELATSDAGFFSLNPMVASRLEAMGKQSQRYLSHEYLNTHWDPMAFDAVARDMDEAKCGFIGSASLLDNIDGISAPPQVVALMARARDVRLKEVLRDLGAARPFRRDLYRRGSEKPLNGELVALLEEIVLTGLGGENENEVKIDTVLGTVTPDMGVYGPMLERLRAGPLALGELRRALRSGSVTQAMEVMSVLAAAGIAHPTPNPAAQPEQVRALNSAIAQHNRQGGALHFQVASRLGTALPASAVETMVADEFFSGVPDDVSPLVDRLTAMLVESGRSPVRDGAPISGLAEAQAALRETVERFAAKRVKVFRRAGILEG